MIRLKAYPSHFHRLLPPTPAARIGEIEIELGKLPNTLATMLRHFNGARLFISAGASFSIFGISSIPPLPPLEWAPEWCIDTFTPRWRAAGANRENDWAIAMTSYGGLILLDENETIKEWDTSQSTWMSNSLPVGDWIENIISEGEAIMSES